VAATATVHAGHIGLVSVRERVEALGGALLLESAPGAGTTAKVTIPRADSA
jgi:signal transduction histidine kinase